MGHITLITGGVRSGKSAFAEKIAIGYSEVAYVATCEPTDVEMVERVAMHRSRRPHAWQTREAPLALDGAVSAVDPSACLLIDCLGIWVSNNLLSNEEQNLQDPQVFINTMLKSSRELIWQLQNRSGPSVLVTNEVGLGLVPPYKLGRVFRDVLGLVNAHMAESATDVYLCAVGLPICLKRGGVNQLG